MSKRMVRLVVLALLAGLLFAVAGCAGSGSAAPTPLPAVGQESDRVVAQAKVVPARSATLSLPLGGMVAEVLAAEGSQVSAGQPILRLDATHAQAGFLQAQAAVGRAQAHLAEIKAGARPQEVAAAAANLALAQGALAKLQAGADEAQIAAARAEAASAEAALKQVRAAYDRVSWDPGIAARPEALALEQATNAYDAAQARLDALVKGPRPADVAIAEAEVARAQAQLDLVRAGARSETVAAAEADVASAQAALQEAQATLADVELRAPFAGTLAWLDTRPGERVAPVQPLAHLGDLSAWEFETEDLAELDVVRVSEGAPATITFDALPGLEIKGQVTRIRAFGESRQGDIVYRVTVTPERHEPRLRWNMTASLAVQPS